MPRLTTRIMSCAQKVVRVLHVLVVGKVTEIPEAPKVAPTSYESEGSGSENRNHVYSGYQQRRATNCAIID